MIIGEDPTYQRIEQGSWKDESLYGTLHRVALGTGGAWYSGAGAGFFQWEDYTSAD